MRPTPSFLAALACALACLHTTHVHGAVPMHVRRQVPAAASPIYCIEATRTGLFSCAEGENTKALLCNPAPGAADSCTVTHCCRKAKPGTSTPTTTTDEFVESRDFPVDGPPPAVTTTQSAEASVPVDPSNSAAIPVASEVPAATQSNSSAVVEANQDVRIAEVAPTEAEGESPEKLDGVAEGEIMEEEEVPVDESESAEEETYEEEDTEEEDEEGSEEEGE